jgi:hypothetical protein
MKGEKESTKILKKVTHKKHGTNPDKHKRKQKVIAQYKLNAKKTMKNLHLKDLKDNVQHEEQDQSKLIMKGGKPKEDFQVMTLDNIDYNQFKLSKKIKINWGKFPDGPPTDCTIL